MATHPDQARINPAPPGTAAADLAIAVLTAEQFAFIEQALETLWQRHRTAKVCFQMTTALARRYGWQQVSGYYGPQREGHYWSLLPGGELLLDCTHDQFDDTGDPVRVARVGDPDYRR